MQNMEVWRCSHYHRQFCSFHGAAHLLRGKFTSIKIDTSQYNLNASDDLTWPTGSQAESLRRRSRKKVISFSCCTLNDRHKYIIPSFRPFCDRSLIGDCLRWCTLNRYGYFRDLFFDRIDGWNSCNNSTAPSRLTAHLATVDSVRRTWWPS